jgi:DHA1 family tetracycline resistance protein-like MFS transporter
MSYRYGWDALQVGLVLAGVGVCSMIVQGALIKPVVSRLGERRSMVLGLAFGVVGFAIYGLAPTGTLFLVGVPVMALWGLASPSIQSLMTRHVSDTEQGKLQGANASLTAIAGLVGPMIFTTAFSTFIASGAPLYLPGAPYLLAAALLVASCAIGWNATKLEEKPAT